MQKFTVSGLVTANITPFLEAVFLRAHIATIERDGHHWTATGHVLGSPSPEALEKLVKIARPFAYDISFSS